MRLSQAGGRENWLNLEPTLDLCFYVTFFTVTPVILPRWGLAPLFEERCGPSSQGYRCMHVIPLSSANTAGSTGARPSGAGASGETAAG